MDPRDKPTTADDDLEDDTVLEAGTKVRLPLEYGNRKERRRIIAQLKRDWRKA